MGDLFDYSQFQSIGPSYGITILVDKETGVNYILAQYGDNINITPRLNLDGTLYVSKGELNDSTN